MVNTISFAQALQETERVKRHLLLGNGFSISLFPNKFRYDSLLENINFQDFPQILGAFKKLTTTDFEVAISALRQTAILLPLYTNDGNIIKIINEHVEALKELLVQAIAGRHPERPSDISEDKYVACRQFLSHFIGQCRGKPPCQKDLRGNVYTLNYDLLLYWVLMHTPDDQVGNADIEHDDGFRASDEEPDAEYVTWNGEEAHSQRIHYLHGALHLYDYGYELQKICWGRSGRKPLIEQIRGSLDESKFPLFVSEGDSKGKFQHIRHSAYLHKGLRSFRGVCDTISSSLFIFGHSLADNDAHILKQIEKAKVNTMYVSLYGNPNSRENMEVAQRAKRIEDLRSRYYPLNIQFFDAESACVWG